MSLRWGDIVAYVVGTTQIEASVQTVHKKGDYTVQVHLITPTPGQMPASVVRGKLYRISGNQLTLIRKAPR